MPNRTSRYAPLGKCDICGWQGHDWAFKYQGLCSKCYKQWKKEKRERFRQHKPVNENVEISEGIVVTRNVKKRLTQQAQLETPRIKWNKFMYWWGLIILIIVDILMFIAFSHREILIAIPFIIIIGIVAQVRHNLKENKEIAERTKKVNTRVEELAREREAHIEEARLFYTSAEWRLLRKKVIKQQGAICQQCKQIIKNDNDITVDHIKPRSLYPEEALVITNLRVLCRSCNSQKGDKVEDNESCFLTNAGK